MFWVLMLEICLLRCTILAIMNIFALILSSVHLCFIENILIHEEATFNDYTLICHKWNNESSSCLCCSTTPWNRYINENETLTRFSQKNAGWRVIFETEFSHDLQITRWIIGIFNACSFGDLLKCNKLKQLHKFYAIANSYI